jgi:hypothetical protein
LIGMKYGVLFQIKMYLKRKNNNKIWKNKTFYIEQEEI